MASKPGTDSTSQIHAGPLAAKVRQQREQPLDAAVAIEGQMQPARPPLCRATSWRSVWARRAAPDGPGPADGLPPSAPEGGFFGKKQPRLSSGSPALSWWERADWVRLRVSAAPARDPARPGR